MFCLARLYNGGVTRARQIAIVNEIKRLQKEVADLRRRRAEVLSGAATATISSGAGSESYGNWSPEKFDAAIARLLGEISALKRSLAGRPALRIGVAQIRRG